MVYTFARAKSVSGAAPIGRFLSNVGSIDGFTPAIFAQDQSGAAARTLSDEVKKIDDYTGQIRQSGPNQPFLHVLTIFGLYIYDKETMEANATEEDPWSHTYNNNVNAPGFGPWCLDDWDKGAGFTARANPDYYLGAPAYDRVVLRKVPQSANRVAILQSGRAQIAERLAPKEYDSLGKIDGVRVVSAYGILLSYVTAAKGGFMNAMNYSNEAVDNALFASLNEADDAKRTATLVDIQETLMEELAMVPILEYKTHWATSAEATGVVWHPDNDLHYYDFRPAE